MNDYDSEKIADLLTEKGYERTEDVHEADLVVFNTCSIREKAQEKVFSDLGRVREAKKEAGKDDMVIAVGGCVASRGQKDPCPRTLRQYCFWSANTSSLASDDRQA